MNILNTAAAITLVFTGFSAQADTSNDVTDYLAVQVAEQTQRVVVELGDELQQSAAALVAASMAELAPADIAIANQADLAEREAQNPDESVLIAGR
ncbi:hypothetical protein [Corallincola spongiicola]|uniref:Uncharacterized protein n=4 Tax=Psychromonadaceae TaxID=267894 RepID=A0A368NNY1_9GAMM|nr:hypothetical protein [Corallincola spongiicola]RCU51583.1 hypothetical protein DU002_03685 [Corallincola holothuriorum]TAA47085.1 hypothetical protein EXY25_07515 [Corallincola spongiicola]TCI04736.1 hypothetical protein EZV61_01835 [Corallincola luteus]